MYIDRAVLIELKKILEPYADDKNYIVYEVDMGYISNGHAAINTYEEFAEDSSEAQRGLKIIKSLGIA